MWRIQNDIHVYSIDEVFIDATAYLKNYKMTAHELAMAMIRAIENSCGATEPLSDFWRIGRGISKRLAKLNCFTMGDVARLSVMNEDLLYKTFGVNAELLIDHAWGWEPAAIEMIKSYQPIDHSLSSGQVLMEPYNFEKGKLIVREMTELMVLDLVRKGVVTKQVVLTVNYDRTSITLSRSGNSKPVYMITGTNQIYQGKVTKDYYGRPAPLQAHGSGNLDCWTNSAHRIMSVMMNLYDRIVDPALTIRRVKRSWIRRNAVSRRLH